MENDAGNITFLTKILKYLAHGCVLGLVAYISLIASFFISSLWLPVLLLGPILPTTVTYGLTFLFLGGLNQAAAKQFWNIATESNIATGMRDGFIISVLFNFAFIPVMLAMTAFSLGWSWISIDPFTVFILFFSSIPLYIFLLGFMGKWIAGSFEIET
ncbi:MAG: hypothetical protein ACFFBJ_09160 [Promethearchaeota archaeon]